MAYVIDKAELIQFLVVGAGQEAAASWARRFSEAAVNAVSEGGDDTDVKVAVHEILAELWEDLGATLDRAEEVMADE